MDGAKKYTFEELCRIIGAIAAEYGILRTYLLVPGPAATTATTATSASSNPRAWDCSRWVDTTAGWRRLPGNPSRVQRSATSGVLRSPKAELLTL